MSFVAVAIGGSAVIGAGVSIASANKASKTATNAANANNALQAQIYDQNKETLAPFVGQGTKATNAINQLLGLKDTTGSASLDNVDWNAYVQNNPDALAQWQSDADARAQFGGDITAFGRFHYQNDGARRDITPYSGSTTNSDTAGFDAFRNSTGYQFQLGEGQKAIQATLGSKGYLDSGAAVKSALKYGQNVADSSFNKYLAALTGQQGVGLTAASAQAGVGQNYAGAVGANNNAAANTSANAALASGGAVNSALGSAVSAYSLNQALGSSYGANAGTLGLGNQTFGSGPQGDFWTLS